MKKEILEQTKSSYVNINLIFKFLVCRHFQCKWPWMFVYAKQKDQNIKSYFLLTSFLPDNTSHLKLWVYEPIDKNESCG